MKTNEYKFYMQACDHKGIPIEGAQIMDLEKDFKVEKDGVVVGQLRYKECKGLNEIGAARVYTEEYSDSDRLRVHIPDNLTHKPTTVTLTLYFVGEERYKVYDSFNTYLKGSKYHMYYDSARKKKLTFFVKDEIGVGESQWFGSTPYIQVEYKLSNIFGKTEDIEI